MSHGDNQTWDFVEEYALELMIKRHGYPMCTPSAPEFSRAPKGFKEYRAHTGPQVGDVGQLGRGAFMCFFNAFLPKDHPLNSDGPDSFIPCASVSTRNVEQYHPADTEINTMRPIAIKYGTGPNRQNVMHDVGAILKLPNGARRVDGVELERIREYAIENAPLWIKEEYISVDDLYVVTGVDLTNVWDIHLQFAPRQFFMLKGDAKKYHFRLHYEESIMTDSPRRWDSTRRGDVSAEHHNQCVFIRGFRIGYRHSEESLVRRMIHNMDRFVPIGPSIRSNRPEVRPLPETFKSFLRKLRKRVARLGVVYDVTGPPDYHPLNIVNKMLLLQNPRAFVAVTHDEDWMSVLSEDDTVTPSPLTLLRRIWQNFEQVRYKEGVYLRPRPHHQLHITTSRALTASRASTEESESDGEAEPITGDISPFLLASIAVSGDIDSRLKNVAQAALNLMQATVRVEVYTREWTFLAGRFISAIASMTCLLADESRTKDGLWDKTLSDIESLLDRAVSSVQNQAGPVPRSRLLSGATSLRDIVYFNTRLGRVLAPLKLPKLPETPTSKIKTQTDIDRTINVVAKKLQS